MKKALSSQVGSVLLEAVVALAVIVIVVTAMAVVVTVSINNANFVKEQYLANKYAQEGIEQIRSQAGNDSSVLTSLSDSNNKYYFDSGYKLVPSEGDDQIYPQGFKRVIIIEKDTCAGPPGNDPGTVQVEVEVRWSGGKCASDETDRFCHKADATTCLTPSLSSPAL